MDGQPDLLTSTQPKSEPQRDPYSLLRKRHEGTEWVFVQEVASRQGRYADAVAVNLWSSRGHAVVGYEVKVNRSDWLRELKQPEKAEQSIFRYCDQWFLVTTKDVVKPGELPVGWGHLEVQGSRLMTRAASKGLKPVPVDRAFFASLVRRAFEIVDRRAAAMVQDKMLDAQRRHSEGIEAEVNLRTRAYQSLKESVRKFQELTGLSLGGYSGPPIETIKLAQRLQRLDGYGKERLLGKLEAIAAQMESSARTVREAMADALAEIPVEDSLG